MQVIKNYFYNVSYQLLTVWVPLVTLTYLAHVLGKEGIGVQSWTNSIASYFVLLGTLGITLYGQREIAFVRESDEKRSVVFWQIQGLHFMVSIIACILYVASILILVASGNKYGEYQVQLYLQGILIIAGAFDISWFFMGLEDFKKTVVRNSVIKMAMVLAIFTLIKNQTDLNKYILLLGLTQFLGNLTLWAFLPSMVFKPGWKTLFGSGVRKHLVPTVSLFIPTIATQIYLQLNKTMLPVLQAGQTDLAGFYDSADKIVKVALSVVTAVGLVMMPRIANFVSKEDFSQVKKSIKLSMRIVTAISVPLVFGLIAISNNFTNWFMGSEFHPTSIAMVILAPMILFIGWSNVVGTQYLVPTMRNRDFALSVSLGAVANIVMNFIFIPLWGLNGAAFATVLSEMLVAGIQMWMVRDVFKINHLLQGTWKSVIPGVLMYLTIFMTNLLNFSGWVETVQQIIVGSISYAIYWFAFNRDIVGILYKRVKRNRLYNE